MEYAVIVIDIMQDVSPYQAVQDLEYLDMVLQESLRIYPAAPV